MIMSDQERVKVFLAGGPYAVVGASRDRSKYGNKVLRAFLQRERSVYPVNPNCDQVEGLKAYPDLASLPEAVHGVSIITPPQVTEAIVEQAGALGIKNLWLQPGAESAKALARAESFGMNVMSGGPCILVALGYREQKA
jgi:predicted CoA-binding protein